MWVGNQAFQPSGNRQEAKTIYYNRGLVSRCKQGIECYGASEEHDRRYYGMAMG